MKKWIATLAAVFALCAILSACKITIDTPPTTEAKTVTAQIAPDFPALYAPLIAEWKAAFESALNEDWDSEALSFDFYDNSDPASIKAYYAIYDIDGNGTPELILRKTNGYEDIVAYIFTWKDSEAINVFGYDEEGLPVEVPWSRSGACDILSNGLIDCMNGNYAIYKIAGGRAVKLASMEPYDYQDEASLAEAKWRYYINGDTQVGYGAYAAYLDTQGYTLNEENERAKINWSILD